jgi:hypothetical protein
LPSTTSGTEAGVVRSRLQVLQHGNDVSVAVLIEDHGHIRAWLDRPPGGGHDLNVTTTEAEDQFGYAAVRDAPAVVEQNHPVASVLNFLQVVA